MGALQQGGPLSLSDPPATWVCKPCALDIAGPNIIDGFASYAFADQAWAPEATPQQQAGKHVFHNVPQFEPGGANRFGQEHALILHITGTSCGIPCCFTEMLGTRLGTSCLVGRCAETSVAQVVFRLRA